MQQPWQTQLDADKLVVDLDPTGDRLHQYRCGKVESVILPPVIERLYVLRDLATYRIEAMLDPTLRFVAAEMVRDRDGDGFECSDHAGGRAFPSSSSRRFQAS